MAAAPGDVISLTAGTYKIDEIFVRAGKDITIVGPSDAVIDAQLNVTGKLTLQGVRVYLDNSIDTDVSQYSKSAIALMNSGDVVCKGVTFDLNLADGSAITAWWSTGDGANMECYNCVFNCNGQRPLRSDACVIIEGCTFNDPYRYAVQMTSKSSTMDAAADAYVNFKNNTINAGTTSSKPVVYGVQLEGDTYGCSNLTINGSGNTINLGTTGKTGCMYYCECGKVDCGATGSIVWNTEVAPVHAE